MYEFFEVFLEYLLFCIEHLMYLLIVINKVLVSSKYFSPAEPYPLSVMSSVNILKKELCHKNLI